MNPQRAGTPTLPPGYRRLSALGPLDAADDASLLTAMAKSHAVRTGRELLVEGRMIPEPLLILEGWAARIRLMDDGRRQFMSFLLPGDLIGMCLHRNPLAVSTVAVLSDMIVAPAPRARAGSSLAQVYGVSHALEEAYLLAQITRLGRFNAQERMGDLFLEFHERLALAGLAQDGHFYIPLTQEMVGDALGLTAVHINRTLRHVRTLGDIIFDRGRVQLPNVARLAMRVGRVSPRVTARPN